MYDLWAVLAALGLLMYLAYRGISLLILAPAMALLAAVLTGDLAILAAYTKISMTNVGDFIIAFFPLFMLGAIFGKLMDDSGCATSIARSVSARLGPERAILQYRELGRVRRGDGFAHRRHPIGSVFGAF